MAKMKNHLNPDMRDRECKHALGFPYNGRIPLTGSRVCPMCGIHYLDYLVEINTLSLDVDRPDSVMAGIMKKEEV